MAAPPPSVAATEVAPLPSARSRSQREWVTLLRRLVRRRTALFGMVVCLGVLLAAVLAPLVSPFDPLEQVQCELAAREPACAQAGREFGNRLRVQGHRLDQSRTARPAAGRLISFHSMTLGTR